MVLFKFSYIFTNKDITYLLPKHNSINERDKSKLVWIGEENMIDVMQIDIQTFIY